MNKFIPRVLAVCLVFLSMILHGQNIDAGMVITAEGTGQTTGNIGNLYVVNYSEGDKEFSKPASIILPVPLEVGQLSQAYIIQAIHLTFIPATGDTVRIPLEGYCLDITKPPAPIGTSLPAPGEWLSIPDQPEGNNPFFPLQENANWPFSHLAAELTKELERPFSVSYDSYSNPHLLSQVIFPVFARLLSAYEMLKNEGKIKTPYADFNTTQKRTVIQYCLWTYTSALEGNAFSKTMFEKRLQRQFRERFGLPLANASEEQKEQFSNGVNALWNAFQRTGEKAGEISTSKSNTLSDTDEKITALPVPVCKCTECLVSVPWKFEWVGFLMDGSEHIAAGDTVPYGSYAKITPPIISGTCNQDCGLSTDSEIVISQSNTGENPEPEIRKGNTPFIYHLDRKGRVDFTFRFQCQCDEHTCPPDSLTHSLEVIESNPCCDRLREASDGLLRFYAGNQQYVNIEGNKLTIKLTQPEVEHSFEFPFNLEGAYCNLNDNRVISLLDSESESHSMLDGSLKERVEIIDVLLTHTNDIEGQDPYYHLRMQLLKEGKEIEVVLTLDVQRCKYDVSVFYDGRFIEYTQPLYSDSELFDLVFELPEGDLGHSYYWNRMLFFGMQFLKGLSSDPPAYGTKYKFWKGKLESALDQYIATSEERGLKTAAQTLRDFSSQDPQPSELLKALMTFINQFHNVPSG